MSGPAPAQGWLRLKRRALELAQPLSAHLELTYRCNWRCVFCCNPRHADIQGLTGDEWISVLDDLRALGTLAVTLSGGEPLTHPDFLRIGTAVRSRGFTLRVFTNGSLVSEAMADALADLHPLAVEMSLHGARPETHDRATQRPGSLAALLQGLQRLQKRNVPLLLKTPLTWMNEGELTGMVDLARKLRVAHQMDATITARDDGDPGPLQYRASPAAIERMYRKVAEQGQLPRAVREKGGVNCGLGRLIVAIDPEGNVYPCAQWRTSSLGNVRSAPLRELWRSSPVRESAAGVARAANDAMLERGEPLAGFPYCPALALERTGDALTPDPLHVLQAEAVQRVRSSEC